MVVKYKEFEHGSHLEMRRAVLNAEMLLDIQRAGNLCVTTPKDLLERFLATIRREGQIAAVNEESVLLLIVGHGDLDNYGVLIGGETDATAAPRLTIENLNNLIGNIANVALVTTSCFSGGWITKVTRHGSKAVRNATAMAAKRSKLVSECWAKSESSGRAKGSIYASALVNAAIRMQTMDEEDEIEEEMKSSSAYIEWAKFIHDIGRNEVDRLFWKHDLSFAAESNPCDAEWNTVSSLPKVGYKAMWEILKAIPIDTANPLKNRASNTKFQPQIRHSHSQP